MTDRRDDPIALLNEYRRLYEEHWRIAQSVRSLTTRAEQSEAHERARALRGQTTLILGDVERHLKVVDISISEVSGGVRPAVVDKVVALAIERHRQRQQWLQLEARAEAGAPQPRGVRGVALLTALLLLGALGWALLEGWLTRVVRLVS